MSVLFLWFLWIALVLVYASADYVDESETDDIYEGHTNMRNNDYSGEINGNENDENDYSVETNTEETSTYETINSYENDYSVETNAKETTTDETVNSYENDENDYSAETNTKETSADGTIKSNEKDENYVRSYDPAYNASCKNRTGRFSIKKRRHKGSIDPYVYFSDESGSFEGNVPRLPEFWKYHSFLQEPLQSRIGGKSLTKHLMDQCMDTYYKIERNIDKACGEHQDGYVNAEKKVDVNGAKHNDMLESYKKQRCQQLNYVSAVNAMVMCLTENTMRQKFIEHYADAASDNPIEGPALYLKKLHEAMEKMSLCPQNQDESIFPNLWRIFKKGQKYDPNAPFFVDEMNEVRLDIMHCSESNSTQTRSYMTDDTLRCTDTHLLDSASVYKSVPGNSAYSRTKDYNCSQSAAYRYLINSSGSSYPTLMDRKCKKVGYSFNDPDLTDKSLSSLYNSVHSAAFPNSKPDDTNRADGRRPFTIAEAFMNSEGPLLDGFGIMYYCGHHACRANHRENPNEACFPKFNWEKDWSQALHKQEKDFLFSADILEKCMNNGLIKPREILSDQRVYYANATIHRRSDLCIVEEEVVKYLSKMYPSWVTEDDALSLVFGRHVAESLCFEERSNICKSSESAYDALKTAVKGLIDKCRLARQPINDKSAGDPALRQEQKPNTI